MATHQAAAVLDLHQGRGLEALALSADGLFLWPIHGESISAAALVYHIRGHGFRLRLLNGPVRWAAMDPLAARSRA